MLQISAPSVEAEFYIKVKEEIFVLSRWPAEILKNKVSLKYSSEMMLLANFNS